MKARVRSRRHPGYRCRPRWSGRQLECSAGTDGVLDYDIQLLNPWRVDEDDVPPFTGGSLGGLHRVVWLVVSAVV